MQTKKTTENNHVIAKMSALKNISIGTKHNNRAKITYHIRSRYICTHKDVMSGVFQIWYFISKNQSTK